MPSLDELLAGSSRTFALTIPLLPEPVRGQVTVAYLVLRIADTIEDAAWPAERRIEELIQLSALLADPQPEAIAEFTGRVKSSAGDHPGYALLMENIPLVMSALADLSDASRTAVVRHVRMTLEGMATTLERLDPDGGLTLRDLDQLKRYCYIVAGLVGVMLTELFLVEFPQLATVAPRLRAWSAPFGEGLQLTNILKDAEEDVKAGRRYLPDGVEAAQVIALAKAGLAIAQDYARALHAHGAPRGVWAFCALPVALARATLEVVEVVGPSAKIARTVVTRVLTALEAAGNPDAFLSMVKMLPASA